jgi:hypothetical protein
MERLTASNYRSLVESYSAVYNEDLRSQLNEEQQIQEFLEFVDALLEEGYDLSEYTYDELYEDWKSQLGAYAVKTAQKYIPRAIELGKKGVKGVLKIPSTGTKTIVKGVLKPLQSKLGSAAATLAGAEAVLAGEKSLVRKGLGKAGEGITALGKAVYGDKEPATAKPQPSKPEDPKKSAWDKLESVDLFDLVKGHLLDEGYADTEEAALQIMANMSEEWRETIIEAEVIAAKDGVPGTMKVKPTKEGGFLGIGAKTVNKPVPGSFNPSNVSSIDAARYNNQVDKNFTRNTGAGDNTDSAPASTIQRRARSAGHSGYMKVNNPDSIPDTGIPNRPSPGRARDQNRARG